eukprot:TRINITY_DN791_c0_g1_i1.p1 TRINITY_DN791_c0_g1~~TRINITY_DN791_c0_g1_i1.p1  ORF type:complete len:291 (-),score=59.37 TRINITY_DN791_c0_g1_i1:609-1481(-)
MMMTRRTIQYVMLVMVVLMVAGQSTGQVVRSSTCVPTVGGTTVLSGDGLSSSSLVIIIGRTLLCSQLVVRPFKQLTCKLPAGSGTNLAIEVNGVLQNSTFSFCAPIVTAAESFNVTANSSRVLIDGFNFGTRAADVTIYLNRVNDNRTLACTNAVVTKAHMQVSCDTPSIIAGEYYVTVGVAGLTSSRNNLVTVSYGLCYSRSGVSQDQIDKALLKVGLRKNIARLRALAADLQLIKSLLPPYTNNDCCDSEYYYPVGFAVLQEAASASYTFKDCADIFSSQSEQFLLSF